MAPTSLTPENARGAGEPNNKQIPGLPWWLSGKESAYQCRRRGFDPWTGRIPYASKPVRHDYWACALTAPELQLLKSACLEPAPPTREATAKTNLQTATREEPLLTRTRESPPSKEDSAQPWKHNLFFYINKKRKPKTSKFQFSCHEIQV